MRKFLLILTNEYGRHVFRWRFLFVIFGPIFLFLLFAGFTVVILVLSLQGRDRLGYVDHAGLLADPIIPQDYSPTEMTAFASESQAQQALDEEKIDAYYVLEADYRQTSQVRLVSRQEPDQEARSDFEKLLRANLLAAQTPQVAERLLDGEHLSIQDIEGKEEEDSGGPLRYALPMVIGFLFMMITFTTSGYLIRAVVEEKENRTMEILVTSVSPAQLIAAKTLGLVGVGLTPMLIWSTPFLVTAPFMVSKNRALIEQYVQGLPLADFGLLLLTLIPAFVGIAALITALGALFTDTGSGQGVANLFFILIMAPLWLVAPLTENPNSPLAIGLSFFPPTAPLTLALRASAASLSSGQLLLNAFILTLFAVACLWLAGRIFQVGLFQYDRRVSWRQVFGWKGRQKQGTE